MRVYGESWETLANSVCGAPSNLVNKQYWVYRRTVITQSEYSADKIDEFSRRVFRPGKIESSPNRSGLRPAQHASVWVSRIPYNISCKCILHIHKFPHSWVFSLSSRAKTWPREIGFMIYYQTLE